ncbi:MAG: MGMT family protein [Candidatus Aenigmarchaeota archaeon]|nr:MGMT family protein [Candidatus Aenigmarchaeota archaeon]
MHKALLLLRKIPRGKVTTYGALAKATKSSPRAIGQIMRRNKHPEIYPCYKCVSASGKIHGYDGCLKGRKVGKKISLLKKDGIEVRNNKINLSKYLHKF